MPRRDIAAFWDRRARENALFFVDNSLDYNAPDEQAFWAGGETVLDAVLSAVGASLRPTDRVVEIGCGVGRLTRPMAARAASVTAVDVSEEMLAQARRLNEGLPKVTWMLGDGVSLAGIPDGTADACVSHVVFQHIPDPAITFGYLRDIGRVLRPGGWAAFQVSNDPGIHRRRLGVARTRLALASALGRAPKGQAHRAWRGSAVTLEDLRRAVDAGHMDIERLTGEGTQFCMVLTRRRATPPP